MQQSASKHKPMSGWSRRKFAYVAAYLLLVCLIATAFGQALAKKMQDNLTWGAYQDYESMAVAISDMVYRLDQGYLAYYAVLKIFDKRLGVDAPALQTPHHEKLHDARYINDTIHDAISIDQIAIIAPSQPLDFIPIVHRDLVPILAEDVGRVDYYKVAFRIFGFNVQSMHYLFFLLLFITSLLFIVGFYDKITPLILLAAELISVNLIIDSNLFSLVLPSISAYRAVSALAIIPITHLLLCIFCNTRIRSLAGATALAQVAIFIFVMWARSSAQWGIIAVFMATLFVSLGRRIWRRPRAITVWPALAVSIGFLGVAVYSHNALNPAYYSDELLPSHFTWHSAYLGLARNDPHSPFRYEGDVTAFGASAAYLAVHRPDLPTAAPMTNGYWFRLHDQVVRHLFFKFALQHPAYMFYLYSWWKPLGFWQIYSAAMKPFTRTVPLVALVSLVIAAGFMFAQLRSGWKEIWSQLLPAAGVVTLASYAPGEWAYPARYVMADAIWATNAFVLLSASVVVAVLVRMTGERFVSSKWKLPVSRGALQ